MSSSCPDGATIPLGPILERSRHNNALDGITGVLWSDGRRFMQVLEGSDEAVEATFARIQTDMRHQDIEVLWDHPIAGREFGEWSMAHRRADDRADELDVRVRQALSDVSDRIRGMFLSLVSVSA